MPFTITRYEATPNPNALKCWLDRPISETPRSFLNAEMAGEDPLAATLFDEAGLTCLLLNGEWMTINKPADADWNAVKKRVEAVLSRTA